MLRDPSKAGFGAARLTRLGGALLHAAVAATVSLASAISGAAVALHFAPLIGESLPRHGQAATRAQSTAVSREKPIVLPVPPTSTVPGRVADSGEAVSDRSGPKSAAPSASAASRPFPEHELTFAWEYAQRHPGAAVRTADAGVTPPLETARAQQVASGSKKEPRRRLERQRGLGAQRASVVGLASSGVPAGFDSDPHQALGYTQQSFASGLRIFSQAQSAPTLRQRKPSPPPHT